MKKRIIFLLAASVFVGSLTGCTGTTVVYQTDCPYHTEGENVATNPSTDNSGEAEENETVTEGALKTGLAVVASVAKSENATQADYDVTQVAVLVDDAGVIQDCIIDGIATQITFDGTGAITADLTAEVQTKNELGENYGMVAYGGAIAEWDAQAEALAQFAVGKTVEELKNGAIDETGKAPEGSDLASSATIYLGGYVAAIEKAVANAKHLGAQAGDELRMACLNATDSSADATADAEGVAQLDSNVAAVTVKDGVITSCYFDSVQAKVSFDQTGTISTDLNAEVQTKNELGENYGMVAYGGAIAEWDAQAAAFAEYVTGKTAEEVSGIAVNEKTAPTEADLTSSVTIAVGGFQALINKALASIEGNAAVTEGALKTGLAVVASVAKSENATQADYDVTQVAVLVDDAGVIQDCIIDGIATQITFDGTGAITADLTAEVQTKNELGENYGMVAYGGAIAEWDAQAEALAQFAVGKTVEELKNGAIDETGKAPEGSDLASSATIYLGGYVAAIEKAVANAKHLGAQAGDELRMACLNATDSSADATADAEGVAQLDSTVTAVTVKDGVITSCYFDSVQAKVSFDQTGTISTDLNAEVQTKNELGENYGMVAYGGAIAEWDAQAAAFAEYVTGKTAEEVSGIAVNEKTAPTEADLTSSVTIAVGGFQALINKALQ